MKLFALKISISKFQLFLLDHITNGESYLVEPRSKNKILNYLPIEIGNLFKCKSEMYHLWLLSSVNLKCITYGFYTLFI